MGSRNIQEGGDIGIAWNLKTQPAVVGGERNHSKRTFLRGLKIKRIQKDKGTYTCLT